MSELINGDPVSNEEDAWEDVLRVMLQARNKGMNRVRRIVRVARRRDDQMCKRGNEQRYRPNQSPRLNIMKWREMNSIGESSMEDDWVLTERIELVIGGKTA